MTWIKVDTPHPGRPELMHALARATAGYPSEYSPERAHELRLPPDVAADSIVLAHSLIPEAMAGIFAGYAAMLDPALPLTRRQHEMLAVSVSAWNQCLF